LYGEEGEECGRERSEEKMIGRDCKGRKKKEMGDEERSEENINKYM
jgi:hypothetical protein